MIPVSFLASVDRGMINEKAKLQRIAKGYPLFWAPGFLMAGNFRIDDASCICPNLLILAAKIIVEMIFFTDHLVL